MFSNFVAKEAEQVQKNLKKQCWNVWYEAQLLTGDDSSVQNSTSVSPAAPLPSNRTTTSDTLASKKSRKVYCYVSQKVSRPVFGAL